MRAGDYADLLGCRVVVITAGIARVPGETRFQVLQRNVAVFEQVVPFIVQGAGDAILLVVSNPVDVMTHVAAHFAAGSDVPSTRVIGTGTMLDTARFRTLLGSRFGVDAQHVHAYVIGAHEHDRGRNSNHTEHQTPVAAGHPAKSCIGREPSVSER